MKVLNLLPVLLISVTQAAYVQLGTFNSKRNLIKKVESNPTKDEQYELEIDLSDKVQYISMKITEFSQMCTWSYESDELVPDFISEGTKKQHKVIVLKDLEFCDYPIRNADYSQETTAMPISAIPEFKEKGTKLLIFCQTGKTALSKIKYNCELKADPESKKNPKPFWDEPVVVPDPVVNPEPVKPSKTKKKLNLQPAMIYINWTSSVISFLFLGVSPCFTAFLDIFDILNVYSMFELSYITDFVKNSKAAINMIVTIFDIHHCYLSIQNRNFWNINNSSLAQTLEILFVSVFVSFALTIFIVGIINESSDPQTNVLLNSEQQTQDINTNVSISSPTDLFYILALAFDSFLYIDIFYFIGSLFNLDSYHYKGKNELATYLYRHGIPTSLLLSGKMLLHLLQDESSNS